MSKYTSGDADVKALNSDDRVEYEVYLLKYDVDAEIETSQGKEAAKRVRDVLMGKTKADSNFIAIDKAAYIYKMIYFFLWSIVMTFLFALIVFFIISVILANKGEVWKYRRSVSGFMLLFIILIFCLVFIIVQMKDKVQTNIEKIIYKL